MGSEPILPRQLYRLDPLIGCGNLLGFVEVLAECFSPAGRAPLSLVCLDINAFSVVNEARGREHGDAVLRWIGIVLEEEAKAPIYRIGGDELVCILSEGAHPDHAAQAQEIYQRLNRDAEKFGLGIPAATVSVIQYTGQESIQPAQVFVQLWAALHDVKRYAQKSFKVFRADELDLSGEQEYLRMLASQMIKHIVELGAILDESNRLAYTDQLTGLPNMRAAQQKLATVLKLASQNNQAVSVLLVDGDDLREYNQISYAAGDEMIQRLGTTLASRLRPGDFLARWRVGDEFLVILPGTSTEQAGLVGERLCQTVHEASQDWAIPVTVSIGVASFPKHATAAALLDEAEAANKEAKQRGKNRVVLR